MLTDPAFLRNPYPELKRIRERAPVHLDEVSGLYFVLGHREFEQMAKSPKMGRDIRFWRNSWASPENRENDPEGYALFKEFQPQMINANGADHKRMRGVYGKAFRPRAQAEHLPMIEEECAGLMDGIPVGEPFDFMTVVANRLPHRVSLRLFEIPLEMEEEVAAWIAALSWLGNIITTPEQKAQAKAAQAEFKAFMRGHFFRPGREPTGGFLDLARAALDAGVMDEEETINNLVMIVSGSRTTLTLLGNGLLTLLRHPAQFAALRADRTLMRRAVEEMLRYEPGSAIIPRAAVEDFECGETTIPAGSLALGLVGAACRDPGNFEDPDRFDITRVPMRSMVFGGGPHICIGKTLARLTAEVAFGMLMDRFARVELAGEPVWWTDRSDQRGLVSLPLEVAP